ncbi:MAG: NnrU family protein [Gammaproteobacteria bacterium]|nr:NnrU family protein [Gammaproteobacteria bacterium]
MWIMVMGGALFLATHLGISSTPLRTKLTDSLGQRGYLGLYSLLAIATLGYLIWLYNIVPRYDYFWGLDPALYWAPKILMPIACVFLLGGFMVRNPTAVGLENMLKDPAQKDQLVRGLTRITRHPFQWSVVFWAVSHMIANGDVASVVFFGTFAILGLLGGVLIDRKKAASSGEHWQPFAQVTSNVPFAAILSGRNKLVLKELLLPVVVGLLGYGVVFWGHEWVSGVRII